MTDHLHQLDYTPAHPWFRRRRRTLLILLAFLVAAALVVRGVRQNWNQLQLLSIERQCMNHRVLAEMVVYQQNAAENQAGARNIRFYIPAAYLQLRGMLHPYPGFSSFHATLFLHHRRSPGGNNRLIAVDLNVSWFPNFTLIAANKIVVQPASLTSPPKLVSGEPLPGDIAVRDLLGARQNLVFPPLDKDIKCFAGQPDPADASHFTFDIAIGQQTCTFDGWLRDNDTVELKRRGPAATQYSRPPPPQQPNR